MRIRSNNNVARVTAVEVSLNAYCQNKRREQEQEKSSQ